MKTRFRAKIAELEAHRPLTVPPPRYRDWLHHWFGRLVALEPGIDLFDRRLDAAEFSASDAEIVDLFEVTMRRSGTDLAPFSDEVVGQGLRQLLDPSFSDVGYRIRATLDVPRPRKLNAIAAMSHLYDDVFAVRCKPILVHRSEPGCEAPLAMICYMLWDVCALGYWQAGEADGPVAEAVTGVWERALGSWNDAVVESALHGLGHANHCARRSELIAGYLHRHPDARPELRTYAEAAAAGCVL